MSVKLRKTVAREGLRGLVVVRPRVPRGLLAFRDRRGTRELTKLRGSDEGTPWQGAPTQSRLRASIH
jgi:hypothetical protein